MPQRHRPREADSQFSRYFYHWHASFSFSLRGSDLHAIAQIHVSGQRHSVSLGQPRKHFIFITAGDSHLDIPAVHRVAVVSEHEMLPLVVTYRAPRYHQHSALFVNQNAHFHVHVRQQLYFVVIHRTEHLAHTARAARHHLLGHLLHFAVPYAVGHRVPQYLHALILPERTQVRFIHECTHAHMAQVRHFRQHVTQLHKITLADRQGIERPIGRSDHGGRANFFFQRGYQVLLLLQAQAGALHIYRSALLERRLLLLIDLQIRARGGELPLVLRDFFLRGRALGDQLREGLLRSFQARDLRFRVLQISLQLRYFIRRPAGVRVAQFRLRRQQIRARLGELRAYIGGVQSQNQLAFVDGLPFGSFHVRNESGELRARHRRRNRLDLAVAGDGGSQILARHAHDLNLRRRPALCQHNQQHDAQSHGEAGNHPFWLVVCRHLISRTARTQASPEAVKL